MSWMSKFVFGVATAALGLIALGNILSRCLAFWLREEEMLSSQQPIQVNENIRHKHQNLYGYVTRIENSTYWVQWCAGRGMSMIGPEEPCDRNDLLHAPCPGCGEDDTCFCGIGR